MVAIAAQSLPFAFARWSNVDQVEEQPLGTGLRLVAAVATAWVAATLSFVVGTSSPRRLRDVGAKAGMMDVDVTASMGMPNPAVQDAKERLMDLLEDSSLEEEVLRPEGKPMRGRVDEAIVRLERLNTQEEPVYSIELDGTWNVKYAGSYAPGLLSSPTRELALFLYGGGFSLGNALSSFAQGFWGQSLGVKLGSKKVQISGGRDVEASAKVEVAGRKETLTYKAELMPLSAQRMSEEVIALKLPDPIGDQDLPLELRRSILVTYLDEDMMIVRDESGVPEVLVKELAPVSPTIVAEEQAPVDSTNSSAESDEDRALLDAAESEAS
ncbi:PAP9 [Symbiodinium sp. CCMP2592]|nr:PAP9 [Symbiodinium sp. CCMP2592]